MKKQTNKIILITTTLAAIIFCLVWPPIRNIPTKRAVLRLGENADSLHLVGLVDSSALSANHSPTDPYQRIDFTLEDSVRIKAITHMMAEDALRSRIKIWHPGDSVLSKLGLVCEFRLNGHTIGTVRVGAIDLLFVDDKHYVQTEFDLLE